MSIILKVLRDMYVWENFRIGGLYYLFLSIFASLLCLALLMPVGFLVDSNLMTLAVTLLIVAVINIVYISLVLLSKRLRDMNYAQEHIWWIFGFWVVNNIYAMGEPDSIVNTCMMAINLLITIWLSITPSYKD